MKRPRGNQPIHRHLTLLLSGCTGLSVALLSMMQASAVPLGQSSRSWGIFSFGQARQAQALKLSQVDFRAWQSDWVTAVVSVDPAAEQLVSDYLTGLSGAGYDVNRQGVWVSPGQYRIADNQGQTPLPAASLTKIATTLAALATWDPDHRFVTRVGWRGQVNDGVVNGDLILQGSGDPLFVWEEAIALGNALQQAGIQRVTGNLIVTGDFTMNFEDQPDKSGELFQQAIDLGRWNGEVDVAYRNLAPGTAQPSVQIDGTVRVESVLTAQASGWLLDHDSLPLVAILKAMNIYSNNPMSEQVAETVGGPSVIMQKVEAAAGVAPAELTLINGSGLGEENQMSPQAAVLMLQKTHDILRSHNLNIADIFPIAGSDGGTLEGRAMPDTAVVKTGSLAVVSALAGVFPTENKGLVWFSLINYGSGLDALRARQDRILNSLERQWGKATTLPAELTPTVVIGQAPYRFGDPERNRSL